MDTPIRRVATARYAPMQLVSCSSLRFLTTQSLTIKTHTIGLSLLTVISGLAIESVLSFPAQAQTSAPNSTILSSTLFNAPPPPPGQGAPSGRRDGGASRGDCPEHGDLTALVPITEGRVWGQTTAAQPTLWFYLPAAITPETPIELIVQDAQDATLYETRMTATAQPGLISLSLPETVALPTGDPHFWTAILYCDPDRPLSSVFVSGTIERVVADGVEPLTAGGVRSLSQARSYAEAGIWHDALTVIAELQREEGSDSESREALAALLTQVGLEQAAITPVQPCCELEPAPN